MDCRIYGFGKLNQCCYNSGSVSHKHEWYGSIVLCIYILKVVGMSPKRIKIPVIDC